MGERGLGTFRRGASEDPRGPDLVIGREAMAGLYDL